MNATRTDRSAQAGRMRRSQAARRRKERARRSRKQTLLNSELERVARAVQSRPAPSAPLTVVSARAEQLDLSLQLSIIRSAVDPETLAHLQAHGITGVRFIVAAALIAQYKRPGQLASSDVKRWPLIAWHPEVVKGGFKADVPYARREMEQIASRARHGWLGTVGQIRGHRDESSHPEYGAGWSTTGTVGAK